MSAVPNLVQLQSTPSVAPFADGSAPSDRAGKTFREQLSITVAVAEETAAVEKAPASLDEYKRKIAAAISAMPIHPSQANASQSVKIHDAVFEKMMNDPEYEKEILDGVAYCHAANFSPADPAFCCISYDADGQFLGQSGGSAHMGIYERESADSFWTLDGKAARKKREAEKLLEELLEKRLERFEAKMSFLATEME